MLNYSQRTALATAITLLLVLFLFPFSTLAQSHERVHIVQAGDTLAGIAIRYGTSQRALMTANRLGDPNFVWVGQRLVIFSAGDDGTTSIASSSPGYHVVAPGDTLARIAARHGTTIGQLAAWNNLANANHIYVGQRLRVAQTAASALNLPTSSLAVDRQAVQQSPERPNETGGEGVHVVQPGDSLSGIAQRHGVSLRTLLRANGISNPDHIYVGQRLQLNDSPVDRPSSNASAVDGVYVVQRGDSLSAIAQRYRISMTALMRANGITNPDHIYVGQRLAIGEVALASEASPASQSQPSQEVTQGKVILVSLSQQHLWAYEDGELVLDTPVTTGRPETPTPTGNFGVLVKYSPYRFISPYPPGHRFYYAPLDSNYSLRLTWTGYHIHDAPWRPDFGPGTDTGGVGSDGQWRTGSLGCVNVPTLAMSQLYPWAEVGTQVVIRQE